MKIKKFKRFVIVLILFLCPQTLFGMGFSSWLICNDTGGTLTTEGVIHAADVIDYYSYVKMNVSKGETHKGIDYIHFNSKGFVIDEVVQSTAQMKYYVYFDIEQFYSDNTNFNYANFSFILSLNDGKSYLKKYVTGSSVSYLLGSKNNIAYTGNLTSLTTGFYADDTGDIVRSEVSLNGVCDKNGTYTDKYMFMEITYNFNFGSASDNLFIDAGGAAINLSFAVYIEGSGNQ